MLLEKPNITHVNTVTHEGKVVMVVTAVEHGQARLYYTVKQDGFEDSALQNPNGSGWEAFKPLILPNDRSGDPSVAARERAELTDKQGRFLLRSLYDSADLTADAPVQLVAHAGHVYVFRQSTRGTLLADRFVLDGMVNTLTPKLEVRFKRSRQRYKPLKAMKITGGGQMQSVDAVDFRDMQNRPFYEPTTEICPETFGGLQQGWFGVVVTPTDEPDTFRWHCFAARPGEQSVDLLTLRAGVEQMFDVQDYWARRVDPVTEEAVYASIPGLISRRLELRTADGSAVTVVNGLAATKYDVQREQQTQSGPQLVRDASKLLLAVPTDHGIAALSFAIAADGTLAQIDDTPATELLRSAEREVLLPLDMLDKVRGSADSAPAAAGTIAGMSRSTDEASADRVQVEVDAQDRKALKALKSGDVVRLSNTVSHDGLYRVGAVKNGSFTIDAPFKYGEVGDWEKVEEEDTGLIFDGMVTGYAKGADGKLTVHAVNHGLEAGDLVQIVGDTNYDGEYPVVKLSDGGFTIQRLWVNSEAVNIKVESRKRRGLVFDGQRDWIEIPAEGLRLTTGFAVEVWVKLASAADQTILATAPGRDGASDLGWQVALGVHDGKFALALDPHTPYMRTVRLEAPAAAALQSWTHVAAVFDGKQLQLLVDGEAVASASVEALGARTAKARQERLEELRAAVAQEEKAAADPARGADSPLNAVATRITSYWTNENLSIGPDGKAITTSGGDGRELDWRFETLGDDRVMLVNVATGQALATDLTLQPAAAGPRVTWRLQPYGATVFRLLSADGSQLLQREPRGPVLAGPATPGAGDDYLQRWYILPVGESRVNRARALLAAAEQFVPPKNALLLKTAALTVGARATSLTQAGELTAPDEHLAGQVADARLWTVSRTPKEIRDSMYLQLTGRETGLAGYWRLGGVATDDDGAQTVADFSVYANHGIVHGAPYAGGAVLSRTLRDGKSAAVKYSNDDLVAVREGAIYVESFEFRTAKAVDPTNADGKDGHLFAPSLWGRLSRGADEKLPITPLRAKFEFSDDLGDGWRRASCRFIVPDGARLLRCFEVGDVRGEWTTLEIRRHSLRLVSDTVTLSTAAETVKLAALAGPLPDALRPIPDAATAEERERLALGNPDAILRLLAERESEEAPLITYEKELTRLLADAGNRQEAERQRDAQRSLVERLRGEENAAQRAYEETTTDPRNYWFNLRPKHAEVRADGAGTSDIIYQAEAWGNDNQRWKLEPLPGGYYKIVNKLSGKVADVEHNEAHGIHQHDWHGGENQQWTLEEDAEHYWKLISRQYNRVWDARLENKGIYANAWHGGDNQRWVASIDGDAVNSAPADAWAIVLAVRTQIAINQAELERLERALSAGSSQREAWERELKEVQPKLAAVRSRIATLVTGYMTLALKASSAALAMPDLPDQSDPRGLKVQGALLPFARPATRLHALESCTGRVTLSYQDEDGALRQSHYDTAYDADGKGEEWLPDAFRIGIVFGSLFPTDPRRALTLPAAIFEAVGSQVTVEFWAKGGAALPAAMVFLSAEDSAGNPRLRISLPDERGEIVWEAGEGSALDRLSMPVQPWIYRDHWTHWAFVKDSDAGEMRIYCNGRLLRKNDPKAKGDARRQALAGVAKVTLGGASGVKDVWHGRLAEFRVWNVALGEREVEANSVLTLSGNEPGLVAYYPFDEPQGETARDRTGRPNRDVSTTGCRHAPVWGMLGRLRGGDNSDCSDYNTVHVPEVLCAEYSRVRVDAQKRKSVMMLRTLAMPAAGGVHLLDEARVEELEMQWIGNAQIKPTLIGYIEGAPPLPTENLTEEQDYNGATAVELIQSSDVEYSWTREQDTSLGVEAVFLVGAKSETSAGIGMMTSVEEIKTGVGAKANFVNHWQNASTVGASHSLMSSDRLELRGSQEADAHFPHLGQRFIPKNIGYALVTSGLADVFVSKLKRSGRMVGYQVLPVDGVPLDVNTITFLINPAYIMAGSLDGLTGSRATSDRFFRHVPEMRSQYGSLYPASYFRLKEAYDLKNQIDQQDKLHESYFNQFTAGGYFSEGDMDRQLYSGRKDGKTVEVASGDDGGDEQDQELETKKKELAELKKATPVDQAAVDAKQREIDDLETERKSTAQGQRKQAGEERQGQINAAHSDLSARANASDGFASWQRKLEALQIRAGKRNIVNTYVWDGDGGFHAEEQQFASTVEHSVGGSFDVSLAIGGQMSYAFTKVLVELSAYVSLNMTQTMSKTERSSKGMELHVDLSGVESRGITDYRDYPLLPGEKVDRYRFMSFFLENSTNHWHDFFNYVVDPEWLASNDEEARALRQTQSALPNKVWRVLHRVTYVERPALMGFGRPMVKQDEAADDIRALRDQLTDLQGKVATLQKEINEKLDQLLTRKA